MLESPISRVLLVAGLLASAIQESPVRTVSGLEASDLVARVRGAVVMSEPIGGMELVVLPTKELRVPRAPDVGSLPVHSVAGPDARGRIAFVENDMLRERHALKLLDPFRGESTVFAATGDALWGHAAGEHLALDGRGTRAALIVRAEGVEMRDPDAYLMEGELEVWSIESGERVFSRERVLDDALAWFPDGARLAYTALIADDPALELPPWRVEGEDGFGFALAAGWKRVPVVHVLDLATGESSPLHLGQRPVVSPDGRTLLVRDLDLRWRILDLESKLARPFVAPGAVYPGAIAFVDPSTVLYWAWPTEGASIEYTEHNSPLVGKKQMRALKLVDLRDGRFQTAIGSVDPRRAVSFGALAAAGG